MDLQILIGGPAGRGIMASGRILGKTALRHGFSVFGYPEYPSLIRGGHNAFLIRISESTVSSQRSAVNLLVALDGQTIELHKNELEKGGGIIYDPNEITNYQLPITSACADRNYQSFPVPSGKILDKIAAPKIVENSVVLGAVTKVLGFDLNILKELLAEEYTDKGEEIIKINQVAAEKGFESVPKEVGPRCPSGSDLDKKETNLLLTGNEVAALSAIAAGCQDYFAYPMTPSTSILHFLAQHGPEHGIIVVQPEDEIAVINMAIGASFAGARCMIATSGGGFCLMTEGLGLAGMTETPLVIVDSQRSGPTTGMPTWTEQGDLLFTLHAHQSDFPRIVLAPGDAEEIFDLTFEAFNLADNYQLPAIILLDKYLSESLSTFRMSNVPPKARLAKGGKCQMSNVNRGQIATWKELAKIKEFKRYQLTDSGVSPRSLPGQEGGIFRANSDEHDEYGFSTEDKETRVKMMDKRMRKLKSVVKEMPQPKIYGTRNAEVTFVGWGSTKGPALEAISLLNNKANYLHLNFLWPFPVEFVKKTLFMAKKVILLEGNYSGQLYSLIKEQTGEKADDVFLKYDGRPFYPKEIVERAG